MAANPSSTESTPSTVAGNSLPTNPEDVLSIRDPNIDVDALMAEIRAGLLRRRAQAEAQGMNFDDLARGRYAAPLGERFPHQVYETLYLASMLRDQTQVEMLLTSSSVPVIGGLIQKVRAALHQVAMFYVNMAASKQISFNIDIVKALSELIQALDAEQHQKKIAALEARVAELERALNTRTGMNSETGV